MEALLSDSLVLVERGRHHRLLRLNRERDKNSLDAALLAALDAALDDAETDADCRAIVLAGNAEHFCSGMDFGAIADPDGGAGAFAARNYMNLLQRIASMPHIVISIVEGRAMAGGVGLVAASDLVIGGPHSSFALPETLWGLLPACVTPFLIRRVGFQCAYRLTITADTMDAEQAWRCGLLDVLGNDPQIELERVLRRMGRLARTTIDDLKRYYQRMWIVDQSTANAAIAELDRLLAEPRVLNNIRNFVVHKVFPWNNA